MRNNVSQRLLAPTGDDLAAIGEAVLRGLPDPFATLVRDVPVVVQDFADTDVLQDLSIEDPFDLLGLYQGVPIGHHVDRSLPPDIDRIFLYRRPILDFWIAEALPLERVVKHVLIHEIGHHMGLSDADMDRIELEA